MNLVNENKVSVDVLIVKINYCKSDIPFTHKAFCFQEMHPQFYMVGCTAPKPKAHTRNA